MGTRGNACTKGNRRFRFARALLPLLARSTAKGCHEGSFALLRTVMSHLRAPTGTRLHAPEEDYALQKYNAAILKAAEKISPQRAALLIKPVMTWQEFADCVHWANNFIAHRIYWANIIDNTVYETYWQFFAFGEHVLNTLVCSITTGQDFAVEKQSFTWFPAGDFFRSQSI